MKTTLRDMPVAASGFDRKISSDSTLVANYSAKTSFVIKSLLAALMLFLLIGNADAATIISAATGNWNATGTWVGGVVPVAGDDVTIATGHTVTVNAATGALGSLTIIGTLNVGGFIMSVTNATNVTGTINFTSATGTKTFSGAVTLNAGAVWNETAAAVMSFAGNFTNNATTFTASTGVHTFSGSSMTLGGSTATSIANTTITGTRTNNGTLTVGTALSGSGTLTNGATTGVLNIGGTSTITTLTATAADNTVNYTGAVQTVKATTYVNLTLSGTGAKTMTGVTVNGILTMAGTATASAAPTYGASATLRYSKPAAFTAGVEWPTSFTASGGVEFTGAGAITQSTTGSSYSIAKLTIGTGARLNQNRALTVTGTTSITGTVSWGSTSASARAMVFTGDVMLNSGAVWIEPATGNGANDTYNFAGNFTNNATTFTGAGTGIHTFSGATKTISGSTTTSIANVAVTGTVTNNGKLTVTTALTGAGTLTNGATGVLTIGGTSTITTLTASTAGNTVNYSGAAQTLGTTSYSNLVLSGSGTKTFAGAKTIGKDLSITGTAVASLGSANSSSLTLQLAGVSQAAGTWGSTASAATNKTNTYFLTGATGILDVTSGCTTGQWVGTISTDWATANNWCGGTLPTASTNVTIPSGTTYQPTIGASAVCNDITISSGATLTISGANTLTVSGNWSNSGTFTAASGTVTFNNSPAAAQTITGTTTFNNLTINNTAGVSLSSENITVNGILNLASANVSSTQGTLSTGTYTLLVTNETATTTGTGDVTGIVKRQHTFNGNTAYSFGSQITSLNFMNTGNKPGWVSCKISIGAVPGWTPTSTKPAIKRVYSFATDVTGAGYDQVITNLRYLDSELNSNMESRLVFWDAHNGPTFDDIDEHGKTNNDTTNSTNSWVGLSGLNITYLAQSSLDSKQFSLGNYSATKNTWLGVDTDWAYTANWSAGHAPGGVDFPADEILIPSGKSNYPTLPADKSFKSVEIQGTLTADSKNITISGKGSAWINHGTFTPGTGKVTFSHNVSNAVVSLVGTTNFYDLEITGGNTFLQPATGSITRIAGSLSGNTTGGILDFVATANTVEYNGTADRTIINPDGPGADAGYHNLIISNTSGTITLPSTLNIAGDFTNNTGGTLTTTGSTVIMKDNEHAQAIGGTASTTFNNLTIDNTDQVVNVTTAITVSNVLAVNSTTTMDMTTVALSGVTSTSGTGTLKTQSTANPAIPTGKTWSFDVIFNGSSAQNLSGGTYSGLLQVSNSATALGDVSAGTLTIDAGKTLDMVANALSSVTTVSGTGTLKTQNTSTPVPSGKTWTCAVEYSASGSQSVIGGTYTGLTVSGSGTKTLASSATVLTGNLTQSGSATLTGSSGSVQFNGTAAQTITGSGSITFNDLSVNNTAGVTVSGDITVNGVLDLAVANPSATVGSLNLVSSWGTYPAANDLTSSILSMGASATTTGLGDVTGKIARSTIAANTPYTFGNQFSTAEVIPGTSATMPTSITMIVKIGSTPAGHDSAVARSYELVFLGGANATVSANLHYLDNELQSTISPYFMNTEDKLVTWDYDIGTGGNPVPDQHGRATYDFVNNYIGFANVPISYFIYVPTTHEWRTIFNLCDFGKAYYTWNGSASGDWNTSGNWTVSAGGSGLPNDLSHVIIPDAATTSYDPVLPNGLTLNTVSISDGGILTMGSSTLTISNTLSGGWEDQNIAGNDPGTSTVIFGSTGSTVSGHSRIYNVQIAADKDLTVEPNSTMMIQNAITRPGTGTGLWYAHAANATVEYTGSAQDVPSPDGTPGYNNLVLSGTGNKTLTGALTTALDVSIGSGTALVVPDAKGLTVTGTLSNGVGTAGLVVESGGSLIQNTGNVEGTVERYIAAWGSGWIGFHLLSSPVAAQAISNEFVPTPFGATEDFYAWWEPTNEWVNFKTISGTTWSTANVLGNVSGEGDFIPAKGYLVEYESADTKQFTGTLNNTAITVSNLPISSGTNQGWHLLGNPFQSAVTWNTTGWSLSNINATAKIWKESTGAYVDISSGGPNTVIPSMNGFMVQATVNGTNSVTIPLAARTHSETAWYKSTGGPLVLLEAANAEGAPSQESIIRFSSEATTAFDPEFDSHFLPGYAPLFYAVSGSDQLSTIALPETGGTIQIPYDFVKNTSTSFTITARTISDVWGPVILNDLKTGTTQDLSVNPVYAFTSADGDNIHRFMLGFNHVGIGETSRPKPVSIYTAGNTICISSLTGNTLTGEVYVYNMVGQLVAQDRLTAGTMTRISPGGTIGYYLVKVVTPAETFSGKVFINH